MGAAEKDPFVVKESPEFNRVFHLPRRDWEERIQTNDLYLRMTTAYRTPAGQQTLRPIQAAALADLHDSGGLLAPIGVGQGKTLLTYLAPTVVGAQRPVLLLPAALKRKTRVEFRELFHHWTAHPTFLDPDQFDKHCISYELLGRDSAKSVLSNIRPDLIIADEAHRLKNRDASVTRRVERYMIANPSTMFAGMSGTITKRSVMDFWHLVYWALKEGMPLPRFEHEAYNWAEALDERKTDAISRRDPGALFKLCTPEELAEIKVIPPERASATQQMMQAVFLHEKKLTAARKGFQRRLRDTPGVVCSNDTRLDCSLVITELKWDPGAECRAHLDHLRATWETPNGDLLVMPTDVWRQARELACGFYYRWDPPAPEEWKSARKSWNWWVRQVLYPDGMVYDVFRHLNLDSPMQVARAVAGYEVGPQEAREGYWDTSGGEDDPPEWVPPVAARAGYKVAPTLKHDDMQKAYADWVAIRDTFKPNTVANWIDDGIIQKARAWAKKHKKGIIWTEHRAFGNAIAAALGTGFCAQGGLDANGRSIEEYKGELVVASVAANKEGRNLQAWNRSLVVTAPPNGALWEQLLGRTHRMGQTADTVYVDWVNACEEQDSGFSQLLADARYIEDTTGQQQKLIYADHVRA